MSERKIVPMFCGACSAPMRKRATQCAYCRTEHEPIERYSGPEIPEFKQQFGGRYTELGTAAPSTVSFFGSYDTYVHYDPHYTWRIKT